MKRNYAIYCLFVIFSSMFLVSLSAQQKQDIFTRLESAGKSGGTVNIAQDDKIKDLFNLHLTEQKTMNGIKGYRIVIYRGSGQQARENVNKVRAGFLSKYENVKCYVVMEYPFYVLYAGDYRTKSEAIRFSHIIDNDYPDAFITRDIVIAFPD